MSSKAPNPILRSAAWRISLWATLAFAVGTLLVFAMLHRFMADDIQRRSDAWLSGEVEVLSDVAERTPKDRLYGRVVGEVAELASREVPNRQRDDGLNGNANDSVFFLQADVSGPVRLWVGTGDGNTELTAIRATKPVSDVPFDLRVKGFPVPFRVAAVRIQDGSSIYLGLSEKDELHVLRSMRVRFLGIWLVVVLLGFFIVFYATRRMLGSVRGITDAASRIGQSDLSSRVPDLQGNDEFGHLARTLNKMLDRVETTVYQLHTMTDALAHDLRSPLTAVRGKLETALLADVTLDQAEPIVSAIDELDRLTELLTTSLDIAEARADALRLNPAVVDLDELLRGMIDLYEPCMSEKGLCANLRSRGALNVTVDASLFHRLIANLLDNALKHLPAACTVFISLYSDDDEAVLTVEDDGPGFEPNVINHLFGRRVKGVGSQGYGLGLAFVEAVVRAHRGTVVATNRAGGGSRLEIRLPLASAAAGPELTFMRLVTS